MRDDLSDEVVTFEVVNATGIIRLNRPRVHNAVNEAVIEALEAALDRAEADAQIRALIVTGAGSKTFCAGGDLQYFATLDTREKGVEMSRRMQALLDRLWSGRKVVIAAINGQALGGGCEILTACHFRIASATARFGYVQAENGLITGWGGGARLFELVGRTQALRLLLTAERVDAAEALRIGLIDRVAQPKQLRAAALDLAMRVSRHHPDVVAAILELAKLHHLGDLDRAVGRETALFADRWTSETFREAINKFQNKRFTREKKKGD